MFAVIARKIGLEKAIEKGEDLSMLTHLGRKTGKKGYLQAWGRRGHGQGKKNPEMTGEDGQHGWVCIFCDPSALRCS